MKAYLAAPLFSPSERALNEVLAAVAEPICSVYLPQRDGKLVEDMALNDERAIAAACKQVYVEDLAAVRQCDVLIAVLDGRALDEGVCIEIGFAKALGKWVVGYKTDVRTGLPWGHNPILSGCVDAWVQSADELRNQLEAIASAIPTKR